MGIEAKIKSIEIKNEDSINKIYLTCEAKFGHNIQALLYNPAGDYSIPLPDDFVTLIEIPGSGNYIAIGNLNNQSGISKGEKKLYSRNAGGIEKASIKLDSDGKITIDTDDIIDINAGGNIKIDGTTDIEFNGNTKRFVTYAELNSAITTFMAALLLHTHPDPVAGNTGTVNQALTFDISASETQTIKTGG